MRTTNRFRSRNPRSRTGSAEPLRPLVARALEQLLLLVLAHLLAALLDDASHAFASLQGALSLRKPRSSSRAARRSRAKPQWGPTNRAGAEASQDPQLSMQDPGFFAFLS